MKPEIIVKRLRSLTFTPMFVTVFVTLGACSSHRVRKPVQVEDINTKLEVIQPLETATSNVVGVRDGVVLVQTKKSVPEQMRKLENEVYYMEDEIYGNRHLGSPGLYGVLKKCMTQLIDRRIGGNGKLVALEAEDRPTEREEEIRFGVDEKGRVVSVSEEAASDRMARFMEYRKTLKDRRKDFETRIDVCEQDIKNAAQEADQSLDKTSDQNLDTASTEETWTQDSRQGTRDFKGLAQSKK